MTLMKTSILIIEDDVDIAQLIQKLLTQEGFACQCCHNGLDGLRVYEEQKADLIVLDLMLPGLDGLEVCTRIRRQAIAKDPYILMLTARGETIDRVIGLSTGADDYLVKPFSPVELVARVRALLRRSLRQEDPLQIFRTPHFMVNLDEHCAYRCLESQELESLNLTTLEFKLFATFMSHPGRAWNRSQLIEKLWGDDFFGEERVVDNQVARLRKKIEPDAAQPSFIKTVIGVGYKFEDPGL